MARVHTPSLSSVSGFLILLVGVGVSMFLLSQFSFGRQLTGTSKGTLTSVSSGA